MSSKSTSYCVVFLCAGLLLTSGCSSSSNPAGPSDTPPPTVTPPSNTPPSTPPAQLNGAIKLTVNPNPVPFSGKPITDLASCRNRNNTWYYEVKLEETGGVEVVFHTQLDGFDGFVVNTKTNQRIVVPAKGSVTLNPRWCSSTSGKHTSQHTFTGADANGKAITVSTGVINLNANTK